MRAQYHFRQSPQGLRAWNVRRLVELSSTLPRERVPLPAIRELDEPYWDGGPAKWITCRQIAEHARLIRDLTFPVILSSDGSVMDGMHRICKALLEDLSEIDAVRLPHDPEPDYIGVHPDDLRYDE
ncbi:MAG TPA: hypothetical protein VNU92_03130 [Edaphobacter sp.]|jgi:hypothetical protein|nr:hypothetical protein [Edaphobacter sp.]